MTNVAMLQTAADLSASITAQGVSSLVPSGVVMAYAGATAPTGWLLCNGSLISRTTYADLFAALSTAHGSGDGSTTFALPNYAGQFLRGRANGSANDPDRASRTAAATGGNTGDAVGSIQTGQYASHYHALKWTRQEGGTLRPNMYHVSPSSIAQSGDGLAPVTLNAYDASTPPVDFAGGNETRPRNAYVNYIIKI